LSRETDRKVEARKGSLNLTDPDETASLTVPSHLKGRKERARPYVVVLLIIMMAGTAVFAGACGVKQVGDLQRQSQSVDVEDARSARADLRMGAGELNLSGGADTLMEADFTYNVADWKPEVDYEVSGDTGELSVKQDIIAGVPVDEARNEWDIRLNDDVPTDLNVQMGAGESNLDLDSLTPTGLTLHMGTGKTTVDLTGDYAQDFDTSIEGGVGKATVLLPSEVGARVSVEGGLGKVKAEGLRREDGSYVNATYGDSEVTLDVDIQGGVGQITVKEV
jgi:N-terminal domain of toast_rack, DUF2154